MYLILPLSLNMKFKRLYSISQIQNKVFNISFWLSPFTCVALLNISFSPALYIFLEIPFHPVHRYTGSSEKKGKAPAFLRSKEDANQEVNQGLFKEATRRALSRQKEKKMNCSEYRHQFPNFSGLLSWRAQLSPLFLATEVNHVTYILIVCPLTLFHR